LRLPPISLQPDNMSRLLMALVAAVLLACAAPATAGSNEVVPSSRELLDAMASSTHLRNLKGAYYAE